MVSFKGAHVLKDIILTCVRWYVAYQGRIQSITSNQRMDLIHQLAEGSQR
jgi:hypothetical protein